MKKHLKLVSFTLSALVFICSPFASSSQIKSLSIWDLNTDGQASFSNMHVQAGDFTLSGFSEPLKFSEKGAYITKWPLASESSSEDPDKYFEVTLSPNSTFPIKVTALHFFERRSNTGIRDYKVKYSLDGFQTSTTIATIHVPDDDMARDGKIDNLNITIPQLGTLLIRWYGYNAEALNGTWRIEAKTLAIKGFAIGAPFTESTLDSLAKFTFTTMGAFSDSKSFQISGDNLISDVSVSVDPHFEVSADDMNWSTSLTFNHNGTLLPQSIYCRFSPSAHGLISGNISLMTGNAMPTFVQLFGQGVNPTIQSETFENLPHSLSYGNYSWIGDNGNLWEVSDALLTQSINSTKAVTIRNGKLTSPLIENGINSLALTTQNLFASAESGELVIKINGNKIGKLPFSPNPETFSLSNLNISGDFVLEIETPQNGARVTIDDLVWTAIPTNIHLHSFEATAMEHFVLLNWKIANRKAIESIEIQKSRNGREFNSIGKVVAENSLFGLTDQFKDMEMSKEKVFYRLKIQDHFERNSFSKIVVVATKESNKSFELKANVIRNKLKILIHAKTPFDYSITDLSGRLILYKANDVAAGEKSLDVRHLSPGIYVLKIQNEKDLSVFKFVKQ